jgi:hypothetical protein
MKFQVQTSFFNFDLRGNSKKINVGNILTQKQFNDLTPSKKEKCSVLVTNTDRHDWTRSQVEQIVDLYLQNDNLHEVRDTFMFQNPDQPHTINSVYQTVAQLRTLDINYPEDTQWKVTQLTEEVATEIAPDRFGSVEDMKALALQNQAEAILAELVG